MDLSTILGAGFGAPHFSVELIYCTKASHPMEVTQMYSRGDSHIDRAAFDFDKKGKKIRKPLNQT